MNFDRFKTFIFDLDGTIWNWKTLFPGVRKTIENLKSKGKQVLFVTNNSLLPQRGLIKKLKNFGIDLKKNELINSSFVIAEYLRNKNAKVFAIGKGIRDELKKANVKITERSPNYLVVGQDLNFNFQKLTKAYDTLERGAKFLTAARGQIYYIGDKPYPATGVLVKAIEHMSNRRALLLGKPSIYMLTMVNMFVCSPMKKTVLFGDELDSDILLGKRAGYYTVLVRTGIDKEAGRIKPDLIIDSVADIKI